MTNLSKLQQISVLLRELNFDEVSAVASYAIKLKVRIEEDKKKELMKNMDIEEVVNI